LLPWQAAQVAAIAGGAAWDVEGKTAVNKAIAAAAGTRELVFTDIALIKKERSPARRGCRGRDEGNPNQKQQRLLLVADLVNGARLVVGNQQRAVGSLKDVGWTADDLLVVEP